MKILYGYDDNYVDVSDKINYFIFDNYIYLPSGDKNRQLIFNIKKLNYLNNKKDIKIIFDNNDIIRIKEDQVYQCFLNNEQLQYFKSIFKPIENSTIDIRPNIFVDKIHQKTILYKRYEGTDSWDEEYPEQVLSAAFINPDAKVLELGSNIGRVSMVIASKLKDDRNLVTLECDFDNYIILEKNRISNNFKFNTINAALSKRRLIQKDWNTIPSDIDIEGYTSIPIISLNELKEKYKIEFDTLVCDCEGALFYILIDFPDLLTNIKTIIIENDFLNIEEKNYVDKKFIENGFNIIFSLNGGLQKHPCKNNFYEVWSK